MIVSFTSILLVGAIGGLVPLVKRWTDRGHHAALAFSTGIFLGAVFLHLLPASGSGWPRRARGGRRIGGARGSRSLRPTMLMKSTRATSRIPTTRHHDHESPRIVHVGHSHGPVGPWLWVLVGLLGVFVVEALLIPDSAHGHGHDDQQLAVGWSFVGLSVCADRWRLLAAVQEHEELAGVMLLAILAHKGFESFSLASVFGMTDAPRRKIIAMVVGSA